MPLFSFSNNTENSLAATVSSEGLVVHDGFGEKTKFSVANSEWLVLSMVRSSQSWLFVRDGNEFLVPAKFPLEAVTWENNSLGTEHLHLADFSLVEGAMSTPAVHALHMYLKDRLGARKQMVHITERANTSSKYLAKVSEHVAKHISGGVGRFEVH